jgi:hypothetical protein
MASLPALRTLAGLRRKSAGRPAPSAVPPLMAKPDPKAIEARRLRAEDRARQSTSVAPPS